MKKIKSLLTALALFIIFATIHAQSSDNQNAGSFTSDKAQTSEDDKKGGISGGVIGGVAILVLGVVIFIMVRNRRNTIGGIQSQNKPSPTPVTTESVDNPGSGV